MALTELWIAHCKEIGINPWISFRMGDCHCPDDETSFLRSDFFYTAKKNGWILGDDYGYFKNCLNYTRPEYTAKDFVAFSAPAINTNPVTQLIEISGDPKAEINYIELKVNVKN